MPKHNISPSTRLFPRKERYEIFDINLVEKIKFFVQHFVPIRTALRDGVVLMIVCLHVDDITVAGESEACDFLDTLVFLRGSRLQEGNSRGT